MVETKEPLGWFDLPPEIRNKIYKELFSAPDDSDGWSRPVGVSEQTSPEQHQETLSVQILRTSKRVYNEAVGILYSESTLCFADPGGLLETILPTIGAKNLSFVRHASLPWPEWAEYYPQHPDGEGESSNFGLVALLVQHCPHIQEIEFDDLGLRGTDLGIEHVLNAVQVFESYLRTIPSLRKVTVWVNPCDRWRKSLDDLWEPERRVEEAVAKAGWVLQGREHYRL
ncbi:hypothetical protein PG993_000983 [Apiospora rasikravindrae]|uniref:DUF7730 domain-containing protein n=1 Tax=Apiospora rasikravindrae TaxID=990691 RepID=A0ABR1UA41_9PEZI